MDRSAPVLKERPNPFCQCTLFEISIATKTRESSSLYEYSDTAVNRVVGGDEQVQQKPV